MPDTDTAARLVLAGYEKSEAEAIAARLDGAPSASPAVTSADEARPAMLAAAEAQRARDALAASNAASPEADSDASKHLGLTVEGWAALDRDEYQRAIAVVTAAKGR